MMPIRETAPQRPVNPYGESKLMVERALGWLGPAHGLKHVCLRYFNAAGADPEGEIGEDHEPETHLIPLILKPRSTGARASTSTAPTIRRPTAPRSATTSMSRIWPRRMSRRSNISRAAARAWRSISAPAGALGARGDRGGRARHRPSHPDARNRRAAPATRPCWWRMRASPARCWAGRRGCPTSTPSSPRPGPGTATSAAAAAQAQAGARRYRPRRLDGAGIVADLSPADRSADSFAAPQHGRASDGGRHPRLRQVLLRRRGEIFRQGRDLRAVRAVGRTARNFPSAARWRAISRRWRKLGANTLRVFTVPPVWLLDMAAEAGLRVLVGIPWSQHITFLDNAEIQREILRTRRRSTVRGLEPASRHLRLSHRQRDSARHGALARRRARARFPQAAGRPDQGDRSRRGWSATPISPRPNI